MSEPHKLETKKGSQSYQNPEEIHKHFMFDDIKRWQQEIEIVNVEMIFYKNLIESHLKEINSWDGADYEYLFIQIKTVQLSNIPLQMKLQAFVSQLTGLNECDDLQCEQYYLNDHVQLRIQLERHFSDYKKFKKNILSYLKTRI